MELELLDKQFIYLIYFIMSKTIEVSDETFELIKDKLGEIEKVDISSLDELVGKKIFVRTVTYHLLGEVTKVVGNLVFMENASWVADSKRFSEFVKGKISDDAEIEYVGDYFFNIQSVTDGCFWKGKLPNKTQ